MGDRLHLEYCPFCQKWVEPVKGHTDLVAGAAGSLMVGWRSLAAGVGHYLLKGSRCPICNNVIKGHGSRFPVNPTQTASPPLYPAASYTTPAAEASHIGTAPAHFSLPTHLPPVVSPELMHLERTPGGKILIPLDGTNEMEAIALVLFAHYPTQMSMKRISEELAYSWKPVDFFKSAFSGGDPLGKMRHAGLVFFRSLKGYQLTGAGIQWVRSQIVPRFLPPTTLEMFCVRCKERRTVRDDSVTKEKTARGRNVIRALCPTCGTKMAKFLK